MICKPLWPQFSDLIGQKEYFNKKLTQRKRLTNKPYLIIEKLKP